VKHTKRQVDLRSPCKKDHATGWGMDQIPQPFLLVLAPRARLTRLASASVAARFYYDGWGHQDLEYRPILTESLQSLGVRVLAVPVRSSMRLFFVWPNGSPV
jgi:hypothetical protein